METRLWAGQPAISSRKGQCPDRLWGHPASYPVGSGTVTPRVKRPGREADHTPPPSSEVKNA